MLLLAYLMKQFGLNISALYKQKVFNIKDVCDMIITGSNN